MVLVALCKAFSLVVSVPTNNTPWLKIELNSVVRSMYQNGLEYFLWSLGYTKGKSYRGDGLTTTTTMTECEVQLEAGR